MYKCVGDAAGRETAMLHKFGMCALTTTTQTVGGQ